MKRKVTAATRTPNVPHTINSRTFHITSQPIIHPTMASVKGKDKQEYIQATQLIRTHPEQAIAILRNLAAKYPTALPVQYNLIMALMANNEDQEADARTIELYQQHPDYFFAKILYAEYCLIHDHLQEIPKIFSNVWDPKLLYPHRDTFHISEITAFVGTCGLFFYSIGEMNLAHEYLEYLIKVAPNHFQTNRLKYILFPEPEMML